MNASSSWVKFNFNDTYKHQTLNHADVFIYHGACQPRLPQVWRIFVFEPAVGHGHGKVTTLLNHLPNFKFKRKVAMLHVANRGPWPNQPVVIELLQHRTVTVCFCLQWYQGPCALPKWGYPYLQQPVNEQGVGVFKFNDVFPPARLLLLVGKDRRDSRGAREDGCWENWFGFGVFALPSIVLFQGFKWPALRMHPAGAEHYRTTDSWPV